MARTAPTSSQLLSLSDDLLGAVVSALLCEPQDAVPSWSSVQQVARTLSLVNRRFAGLVGQPLEAWRRLSVACSPCPAGAPPPPAAAALARWLAQVGPAVRDLTLHIDGTLTSSTSLTTLGLPRFLPPGAPLQRLSLRGCSLPPDDLQHLARLTSLTTLNLRVALPDSTAPLGVLSTLRALRELGLQIVGGPTSSGELPAELSALSRLTYLHCASLGEPALEGGPAPAAAQLRLPAAWSEAAAELECLELEGVALPALRPRCAALPALRELIVTCHDYNAAIGSLVAPGVAAGLRFVALRAYEPYPPQAAAWEALAGLPQLSDLLVMYTTSEGVAPVLPKLARMTALTRLELEHSAPLPLLPALPALRSLTLCDPVADRPGWALPPGPYLSPLEHLDIEAGSLGSLAAVWKGAPRLASLRLAGCPWLQFERAELRQLLGLPLEAMAIHKRFEEAVCSYELDNLEALPQAHWSRDSLWVLVGLRLALAARAAAAPQGGLLADCDIGLSSHGWAVEEAGRDGNNGA